MNFLVSSVFLGTAAIIAIPAAAATYNATSKNLKTIWRAAKPGDTIRLSGSFGATNLEWKKSGANVITLDSTKAIFTDSIKIKHVTGLKLVGGKFDATKGISRTASINVYGGDNIHFDKPNILGAGAMGIYFTDATNVSVTNGVFSKLNSAVLFRTVTNGTMSNNKSLESRSDGFQVSNSHKIKIDHNSCTGSVPRPGAHPDCVQLWSFKGQAPQSDIEISDNYASGRTQGFTSFNAADGGGVRISMLRNRADTSYPQGVACYGCFDSKFIDNVVTTLPGATRQTRINIIGGSNNTIVGNSIGKASGLNGAVMANLAYAVIDPASPFAVTDTSAAAFAVNLPDASASFVEGGMAPSAARVAGANEAALSVPEPGVWAMLIAGFGMVGSALRRRPRQTIVAA